MYALNHLCCVLREGWQLCNENLEYSEASEGPELGHLQLLLLLCGDWVLERTEPSEVSDPCQPLRLATLQREGERVLILPEPTERALVQAGQYCLWRFELG